MRKLYDIGLPRQLIELIIELISGIRVCLCWGNSKTEQVERGNTGVPQGSLEGMWNFGVYSDNIQEEISSKVEGISLGGKTVRAIVYADDISPVNSTPAMTNEALSAISRAGAFNAYKFKPSKCKIVGSVAKEEMEYTLGERTIQRADSGLLLGAVIDGRGIESELQVERRALMVQTAIRSIKSWRTKGLSYSIAFRNLFRAKVMPRFTYAFALISVRKSGRARNLIETTLERALCCTFGWRVPKKANVLPGVWSVVCGHPPVPALLRQLKLEMAARLKVSENRAGHIFRSLYLQDRGSFEDEVYLALKEWLLLGLWDRLTLATLNAFKMKIRKIARKCWPQSLPKNGNLSWLYHNHWIYSGNVPSWADWKWPRRKDIDSFKTQFYCLLTGQHSAGGEQG